MDKVTHLEKRVTAFLFKLSFNEKKAEIKPGVAILEKASNELLACKRFVQLLEVVLEMGNFLNENTPRGGVFAFKLSSLSKVIVCSSLIIACGY